MQPFAEKFSWGMQSSVCRKLIAYAFVAATGLSPISGSGAEPSSNPGGGAFSVDGRVALSSLMSLSDGYLQKMADSMQLAAATDAARSGEWADIRGPLASLARRNVSALNWFARPDGSYWSVQNGAEEGNLAHRDYFPKVLAGETVIGDLVVSTSTGKPVAIVAVPIVGADGSAVGILGASVHLERMAARIERDMALEEQTIFYSFDDTPLVALDWDPKMIFLEPMKSGDDELTEAFRRMMKKQSGVVEYTFGGKKRTVIFRRSGVTGWWYAFGVVHGN